MARTTCTSILFLVRDRGCGPTAADVKASSLLEGRDGDRVAGAVVDIQGCPTRSYRSTSATGGTRGAERDLTATCTLRVVAPALRTSQDLPRCRPQQDNLLRFPSSGRLQEESSAARPSSSPSSSATFLSSGVGSGRQPGATRVQLSRRRLGERQLRALFTRPPRHHQLHLRPPGSSLTTPSPAGQSS